MLWKRCIALNPAIDPGIEMPQSDLFSGSEVFLLDLDKSIKSIRGELSENILVKLKEWEKTGAELVFDQAEARKASLRIYPEFIKRIGADAQYHFSPQVQNPIAFVRGGIFPLLTKEGQGEVNSLIFRPKPDFTEIGIVNR